jgi:prolyl-tRNA synthetase
MDPCLRRDDRNQKIRYYTFMLQSQLFTKTRKEAPKDEVSKNAQLLIKGGFINKEMAGVYSFLPLGLKVLNKICNIIREEMNAVGGQELSLTALQDKENWEKTNRWDDKVVDFWFKTKLKNGTELGLGATHEEPLTAIMRNHVRSYKDLPIYPYQIQTKFRNETRAKSGIMRCREFLMKDMYSFSRDITEHEIFYEKAKVAYHNIFRRVGLGDRTYITFASGGSFSKYSHEFQTISDAGEDLIYICDKCKIAINNEIIKEQDKCPQCGNKDLKTDKAIETGNIFNLGTKFSDALDLTYPDIKGVKQKVVMGCYGIGPGRLMGTVVECLSDKDGIVWPASIAPFAVHLLDISLSDKSKKVTAELYGQLQKAGIEVLCDDREARAGEKFADADLLGIPLRIIVSEKTIEKGEFEIKERVSGKVSMIKEQDLIKFVNEFFR